jgi:hypothetical protein
MSESIAISPPRLSGRRTHAGFIGVCSVLLAAVLGAAVVGPASGQDWQMRNVAPDQRTIDMPVPGLDEWLPAVYGGNVTHADGVSTSSVEGATWNWFDDQRPNGHLVLSTRSTGFEPGFGGSAEASAKRNLAVSGLSYDIVSGSIAERPSSVGLVQSLQFVARMGGREKNCVFFTKRFVDRTRMVDGWYCAQVGDALEDATIEAVLAAVNISRGGTGALEATDTLSPGLDGSPDATPSAGADEAGATVTPLTAAGPFDGRWKGEARSDCGSGVMILEIMAGEISGSWSVEDSGSPIVGSHTVAGRVADGGEFNARTADGPVALFIDGQLSKTMGEGWMHTKLSDDVRCVGRWEISRVN